MPLYDFTCGACGSRFEAWLRHWDDPNPSCRACGSSGVTRLAPLVNVVFTGIIGEKYFDKDKPRMPGEGCGKLYLWRRNKEAIRPLRVSSFSELLSMASDDSDEWRARRIKMERVEIETWSEYKRFLKEQKLEDGLPANAEVTADGTAVDTKGLPGQWA